MGIIQQLTPTNLLEEKQKFFADQTYNPQFRYEEILPDSELLKYGKPNQDYLEIAHKIIDKAFTNRNEPDLVMAQGPLVDEKTVEQKITQFLQMHNLHDRYNIVWSSSFIARASITTDTIKLRTGAEFRSDNLLGMIYHEIGTHALRRVNYEQQPWFKKKSTYGFASYLLTEEGLAILHSLLAYNFKLAYKPALRYITVQVAQEGSFVDVWNALEPYVHDLDTRWIVAMRQKRGLEDTSKPGGYTKDLVYFEGFVDVWNWLNKNDFDITTLYFGKLALEDASKALQLNPNFTPLLPSFFVSDQEKYKQHLLEIGQENFLEHA